MVLVLSMVACSGEEEPVPNLDDRGMVATDAGFTSADVLRDDAGDPIVKDASELDAALGPDGEVPADAGEIQVSDGAIADAAPSDGGGDDASARDASAPDASRPDGGAPTGDLDRDNITDQDEGLGIVDTDGDGTPDSRDMDSDNDGITDAIEAGDNDPSTPPRDSDGDSVPDFRDLDSDGDGIADAIEGTRDSDGDRIPDRLDLDSDGDGIMDALEGAGDPDMDMVPSYLDQDSDGDGILDRVEGTTNPDGDALPSFLDPDSDGDTISDREEGTLDPDMDMIPNYLDADSDGDTIADRHELARDPDRDGRPSYLDLDSDGDAIPDAVEAGDADVGTAPIDTDFDGTPNFLDIDSDFDGITDNDEGAADTDGDGTPDYLDLDSDNDVILDTIEAGDTSTATPPRDTDGDGRPDFRELDSDNDTINDLAERANDTDMDMIPDFRDADSDGDGILDRIEAGDTSTATPPLDTDMDGTPDFRDRDSDNDALDDRDEPGCPAGPSRLVADTDMDGFIDAAELALGSNPCDARSMITAFYFILPPNGPSARAPLRFSNTGLDTADLAILMDTSGSMQGEIDTLRRTLNNLIIPRVRTAIPGAAFAVASYEDYPVTPFGSPMSLDQPFRLLTRVSSSAATIRDAVGQLSLGAGDDLPESWIEGLNMVATGTGTRWSTGRVAPFDPANDRIPGVADGTIGGVGFRSGALPIIVQIGDALGHIRQEYVAVDPRISASSTAAVQRALARIGARVVTITSANIPRPLDDRIFDQICAKTSPRIFGNIANPVATDRDFFLLQGAQRGDVVIVETFAERLGSTLDTQVTVFNDAAQIANNDDDIAGTSNDSRLQVTLSGNGPWYIQVRSPVNNNGTGTENTGFYFLQVTRNGVAQVPNPVVCRSDDGNTRQTATPLAPIATATRAASVTQCADSCRRLYYGVFAPFSMPYVVSESTKATVPTCAWDVFGNGRPAGCARNQCCTGINGAGEAPDAAGVCPLAYTIQETGQGLGDALVAGIDALASFAPFTVTTRVRGDPVVLAQRGIDTACFIRSVIPVSATAQNACVPQPVAVDLVAPSPELDAFDNVAPGTTLVFDVNAINQQRGTMTPCAPSTPETQVYRAFIDVIADGVTVLDTRDVVIIVPAVITGGGS